MPKATLVRAAGRVNESNVSALSADPRDVVAPSHDRGRTASVPASHSDCSVPDGDVRTIVYPVSRHGPPVPAWLQRGFRPYPALVAQGIERRFPKPCVAGSNPAGGTRVELGWGSPCSESQSCPRWGYYLHRSGITIFGILEVQAAGLRLSVRSEASE